jgi:hypothetical protein
MTTKKFQGIFIAIFGVFGIAMIIGGFFLYQNTSAFVKNAVPAQGIVIDFSRSQSEGSYSYHPVVKFTTQEGGEMEFISPTGRNPSPFKVNDAVPVLYDPKNPKNAQINTFGELWVEVLILGGLGILFTLIALGVVIFMIRKKNLIAWLKSHGDVVQTDFVQVEENGSVSMNGRHPWRIVSKWRNPEDNKEYEFQSEDIWTDEPPVVAAGQKIEVYIDPKNPKRYFMDIHDIS